MPNSPLTIRLAVVNVATNADVSNLTSVGGETNTLDLATMPARFSVRAYPSRTAKCEFSTREGSNLAAVNAAPWVKAAIENLKPWDLMGTAADQVHANPWRVVAGKTYQVRVVASDAKGSGTAIATLVVKDSRVKPAPVPTPVTPAPAPQPSPPVVTPAPAPIPVAGVKIIKPGDAVPSVISSATHFALGTYAASVRLTGHDYLVTCDPGTTMGGFEFDRSSSNITVDGFRIDTHSHAFIAGGTGNKVRKCIAIKCDYFFTGEFGYKNFTVEDCHDLLPTSVGGYGFWTGNDPEASDGLTLIRFDVQDADQHDVRGKAKNVRILGCHLTNVDSDGEAGPDRVAGGIVIQGGSNWYIGPDENGRPTILRGGGAGVGPLAGDKAVPSPAEHVIDNIIFDRVELYDGASFNIEPGCGNVEILGGSIARDGHPSINLRMNWGPRAGWPDQTFRRLGRVLIQGVKGFNNEEHGGFVRIDMDLPGVGCNKQITLKDNEYSAPRMKLTDDNNGIVWSRSDNVLADSTGNHWSKFADGREPMVMGVRMNASAWLTRWPLDSIQ